MAKNTRWEKTQKDQKESKLERERKRHRDRETETDLECRIEQANRRVRSGLGRTNMFPIEKRNKEKEF